jgi:chromosome segregation ATPase
VAYNFEHKQKITVTELQKIIDKMSFDSSTLDELNVKIEQKKKEKAEIEVKLKNQGTKLENAKESEEAKFRELKEEYNSFRQASLQLSHEIDDLQLQTNVLNMQKTKFYGDKEYKEVNENIGKAALEIKQNEKQSKI